jgi:hypothetical protein
MPGYEASSGFEIVYSDVKLLCLHFEKLGMKVPRYYIYHYIKWEQNFGEKL